MGNNTFLCLCGHLGNELDFPLAPYDPDTEWKCPGCGAEITVGASCRGKKFARGVHNASRDDLESVVQWALALENKLYSGEDTRDALFRLRKSLEAIFGHDMVF